MRLTIGNVVHHDVHACKLRPDLCEEANVRAVDVAWREELEIADRLGATFNLQPLLDLLEFSRNPRAVRVAFAVGQYENTLTFFPLVLRCQPSW